MNRTGKRLDTYQPKRGEEKKTNKVESRDERRKDNSGPGVQEASGGKHKGTKLHRC